VICGTEFSEILGCRRGRPHRVAGAVPEADPEDKNRW